jgi:aminoacylase
MSIAFGENREMIEFLVRYIAIKTVAPDPRYTDVIDLFVAQAVQDGFLYQIVPLSSGYPALLLSLPGTDDSLPSFVMNHHMDVVPALGLWDAPPFEGRIVDNKVIGRGTQDMKGVGVAHYFALQKIKKSGIILKRSVHILLVPDEELGGFGGTACFIKTKEFQALNMGYIIDEGTPSGQLGLVYICLQERKPIQIEITVKGNAAHASKLMIPNPVHLLIKILTQLCTQHEQSYGQVTSAVAADPGSLLSLHITSLKAGVWDDNHDPILNMIPGCAIATVDIRVPPSISLQEIYQMLDQLIGQYEHASYRVIAAAQNDLQRPLSDDLQKALAQTITAHGFESKIKICEGASDMRFYRNIGIEAIGCTPFFDKAAEHTVNESVEIKSLIQAREIFVSLLELFCA